MGLIKPHLYDMRTSFFASIIAHLNLNCFNIVLAYGLLGKKFLNWISKLKIDSPNVLQTIIICK